MKFLNWQKSPIAVRQCLKQDSVSKFLNWLSNIPELVVLLHQIMNLLSDIKSQLGTSVLLITHDLALVGENADEIAVMYAGRIVEKAPSKVFFENPNHPYSKALLNSMPAKRGETLDTIQGQPPTIHQDISGCRFHPRCKYCFTPCIESVPESFIISENQTSACFLNNK